MNNENQIFPIEPIHNNLKEYSKINSNISNKNKNKNQLQLNVENLEKLKDYNIYLMNKIKEYEIFVKDIILLYLDEDVDVDLENKDINFQHYLHTIKNIQEQRNSLIAQLQIENAHLQNKLEALENSECPLEDLPSNERNLPNQEISKSIQVLDITNNYLKVLDQDENIIIEN